MPWRCGSGGLTRAALALASALVAPLVLAQADPAASAPDAVDSTEVYVLDPAHSYPYFEISHLGFSRHRGRFNQTRGRVLLDRAAASGQIEVEIAAASISTGDEKLEAILRSDAFFDVARYPTIVFKSARLHFSGPTLQAADGELTLLGVTRPVRLEVVAFHCGVQLMGLRPVCGADARTSVRRSDFGMDRFLNFGLGDDVLLSIQVEAERQLAPHDRARDARERPGR